MDSLFKYLSKASEKSLKKNNDGSKPNIIDGHCHLFDHTGVIWDVYDYTQDTNINKIVGFVNARLGHPEKYTKDNLINLYDNYITNYYNKNRDILLASGMDSSSIIAVHKKWPKIIKGFGELKCYSKYKGKPLVNSYKKITWIKDICKYNLTLPEPLPIYIHWSLDTKFVTEKIESLFSQYPTIPFVLCHCGFGKANYDESEEVNTEMYNRALNLLRTYNNVYVDISYSALKFFSSNPYLLSNIPMGRAIIGSDMESILIKDNNRIEKTIEMMNNLIKFIPNSNNTIKKLFAV